MAEQDHTPKLVGTPRDTDSLHQALQEHIAHCDECRYALDKTNPRGFGQAGKYCREYYNIVQIWSEGVLP